MATKMNAEIAKRVKSLGIKAADEDAAREELLNILKKNEIEGMEEEDTMTLIEIAESFVETEQATAEEPAMSGESEEELDQLAKESESEQDDAADEDEESEQETDGDEFEAMSRDELKRYIKVNELEISVKKSMSDDAIRDAIRAILADDAKKEELAQEEKQEEKPAEKPAKKAAKKEKKDAEEKPAKKEAKNEEKKPSKRGVKLDPKNNEEDREKFDAIRAILPESEFSYAWLSTYGVTIKHKGANSQKGVLTLENCTCRPDGSITCNMYLLTMAKQLEVLDEKGIDYKPCWTGAPGINGITFDQAVEIITEVKDLILASVTKSDKRLGDNRAKMEENLKKAAKKTTKK